MIALIITPYTGDGLTIETGYRPLILDVISIGSFGDITGKPLSGGVPQRNLYAIRAELTEEQYQTIYDDDRFFVVDEARYNFAEADLWMRNRGFDDHPVTAEDTALQARDKIVAYFREL